MDLCFIGDVDLLRLLEFLDFFIGDKRHVRETSRYSNINMCKKNLLSKIKISDNQIFKISTNKTLKKNTIDYEIKIKGNDDVISEIGVTDLTHAGIFIDSRTFRSFEVFITLSIIYIVLALILKAIVEIIFRKTLGNRS